MTETVLCQHYPCDPMCCPGLECEREGTVRVEQDGRLIGFFCEEHAPEYIHDEDE